VNANGIKIVCFDVGGVLVKHCRTWREGCIAAGLPIRDGAESPEMSLRRKEQAHLYTCGQIDEDTFYRRMAETTSGLYTVDDIRRVHHAWLGPEYDNVGPIIKRLVEGRRIQTGVLSNTNSAHWSRIERRPGHEPQYPTASLLDNHHASYKLGMAKPMPGFYEAFEKNTGYRGSDILFLEDLPDNAAVATARGWKVELIDYTRETAPQLEEVLTRYGFI